MDDNLKTQLEAAAFRHLIHHFQTHNDVQNIDLMILADFCRNCLAKWYTAAAQEQNVDLTYEQAREIIYGMPYLDWQKLYQTEASPEQIALMAAKTKTKNEHE